MTVMSDYHRALRRVRAGPTVRYSDDSNLEKEGGQRLRTLRNLDGVAAMKNLSNSRRSVGR